MSRGGAREMRRESVAVGGQAASYLTAGDGPIVLLLHGTYWSRVWQPVIEPLARFGLRPVAVDLPGCGRSEGELDLDSGSVPRLADWLASFIDAVGIEVPMNVVGHDIGGAIAQRLTVRGRHRVGRLALVNSVTYDSWPVPGVARFRDPEVVSAISADEIVRLRGEALEAAIARPLRDGERDDYLSPWREARVARSWMALAGAADAKYTTELLGALRRSPVPKLLVWGEDDNFQPVSYAERFVAEMPSGRLVRVPAAGHIPMENDPKIVAEALGHFFTSSGDAAVDQAQHQD